MDLGRESNSFDSPARLKLLPLYPYLTGVIYTYECAAINLNQETTWWYNTASGNGGEIRRGLQRRIGGLAKISRRFREHDCY